MDEEEVNDDDNEDSMSDDDDEEYLALFTNVIDGWCEGIIESDSQIVHSEQETISSILKKCRRLVKAISRSSLLSNFVSRLRAEMKITRSLSLDCPTRWNSTHRLIQNLLVNKPLLVRFFAEYKHTVVLSKTQQNKWNELEMSRQDWRTMENIELVLRPFHDATKLISGQTYPTIGMSYFAITGIRDFLIDQSPPSNTQLSVLKRLLLDQMKMYFDEDYDQYQWIKVGLSEKEINQFPSHVRNLILEKLELTTQLLHRKFKAYLFFALYSYAAHNSVCSSKIKH